MKWIAAAWIFATAASAAEAPADIRDAVERLNQKLANTPAALGIEFRVKAAQTLHAGWPDLSRELTSRSVARLRSGTGWRMTFDVMGVLASLDPDGAISVLTRMRAFYAQPVTPHHLSRSGQSDHRESSDQHLREMGTAVRAPVASSG